MTLEKAIETLSQYQKGTNLLYLPHFPESVDLSIEAMKAIQNVRKLAPERYPSTLPGETER